jgi:hypothetical protein
MSENVVKIEKIQNLTSEELGELMTALINKIGYANPISESGYIIAQTDSPLSHHLHAFLIIDKKVNGRKDIMDILSRVDNIVRNHKITTVYIVSGNYIGKNFIDNLLKERQIIASPPIDRDRLVDLVDEKFVDYWRHSDTQLLNYEKYFCDVVLKDSQIKKVKLFSEKISKAFRYFYRTKYLSYL